MTFKLFTTSTPDLVDVNPPATSALKLPVSGTGVRPAPVVIDRADGGRRGVVAAVTPVAGLDPVVSVAVLGAERVTSAKKHITSWFCSSNHNMRVLSNLILAK